MEDKETLVPEGYEIDWENTNDRKIVFSKIPENIDKYPKSISDVDRPYYTTGFGEIHKLESPKNEQTANHHKTEGLANLVLNFNVLLNLLHRVWEIDDWTPDYNNGQIKYCIQCVNDDLVGSNTVNVNYVLTFKTKETRDWFLKEHYTLIHRVKDLI